MTATQQDLAWSKACTSCGEVKPLREFYPQPDARDGYASQCRRCNNARRPTEARLLRNRARTRASAVLVDRHREEFESLIQEQLVAVQAEHARLVAAAAAAGNPDASTARLKPGQRRTDEVDVVQRLDVARCPQCHTHHDDAHTCPSCGEETPRRADDAPPYEIRAWAVARRLSDVPSRGPLPDWVVAAYYAAHTDQDLDDVAIERRMAGEKSIALRIPESVELVRRWKATGRSLAECERVTGLKPERYRADAEVETKTDHQEAS